MSEPAIKLVAFDMEGCLTADPTVWEIMHRKLGSWESHGLPYWQRYCAGGLDYDEFARMDVAAWGRAPVSMLEEAAAEVPLMNGCAELLSALHAAGIRTAVISNGLACVAERLSRSFGVAHVYANRVVKDGERLSGRIEILVPYGGKGQVLTGLERRLGVRPEEVAAVGDSVSDIAMFRAARLGIAFRPSAARVAEAATHIVADGGLTALLPLLLSGG